MMDIEMRGKSWVLIVERFWTLNTDFFCSLHIILFCIVECEIRLLLIMSISRLQVCFRVCLWCRPATRLGVVRAVNCHALP